VLCFLILFAEDADLDKVLRRYYGPDFEVKGFLKVSKLHSMPPQFGM
jgi:hypothetical protein